jgi:endoglucanase
VGLSILRIGLFSLLLCFETQTSWAAQRATADKVCLRGVNVAGAEFGELPGRYGFDYAYPQDDTIKSLAQLGFTAIRLPVRWERLQPQLNRPLDQAEMGRLDMVVASIRSAGLWAVLDLHNYGYYNKSRLGSAAVPGPTLADLWRRLANHFRREPFIAFDLMNEPYDLPARDWLDAANAAVAAIRSVGATQLILVSGTAYSGAHSWSEDLPVGNNGRTMLGLRDPRNNFAYEVHQYLDADFSGRSPACENGPSALKAIEAMTEWLANNGKRGFLGEVGASSQTECIAALSAILQQINNDRENWIGWTAWAAGERWPSDYPFNLQPGSGHSPVRDQLALDATATGAGSCEGPLQ